MARPARPLQSCCFSADRTEQRAIVVGLARMWARCPARAEAVQRAIVQANHFAGTALDRLTKLDGRTVTSLCAFFGIAAGDVGPTAIAAHSLLRPLQHFLYDLWVFSEQRLILLPTQRHALAVHPYHRTIGIGEAFFRRAALDQTLDVLHLAARTAAGANDLFDCRVDRRASGPRLRRDRQSVVDFLGSFELANVAAGSTPAERATIDAKPALATSLGVANNDEAVAMLKRCSTQRARVLLQNPDSIAQLVHCLATPKAARRAAGWEKRLADSRRTLRAFAMKVVSRELGRPLSDGERALVDTWLCEERSLWEMADRLTRAPALLQPSNASVNSVAENGCRSSTDSPTPMK